MRICWRATWRILQSLGGDFPGAYPGTTLFPLLLDLPLAGGELGALVGIAMAVLWLLWSQL